MVSRHYKRRFIFYNLFRNNVHRGYFDRDWPRAKHHVRARQIVSHERDRFIVWHEYTRSHGNIMSSESITWIWLSRHVIARGVYVIQICVICYRESLDELNVLYFEYDAWKICFDIFENYVVDDEKNKEK